MNPAFQLPAYEEQVDLAATCAVLGITEADIRAELDFRRRKKIAQMHKDMALAAKKGGVRRILPDDGDGGGYVEYMVHPVSFHYWGQRLGYECWADDQFIREYIRDNPACRIKSVAKNAKVAFSGPRIATRRGRWSRAA